MNSWNSLISLQLRSKKHQTLLRALAPPAFCVESWLPANTDDSLGSDRTSPRQLVALLNSLSPAMTGCRGLKLKNSTLTLKAMSANRVLEKGKEFATWFLVLGTGVYIASAIPNKLDSVQHTLHDHLYGAGFLGMAIAPESPPEWSETTWAHVILDDGAARAEKDILRGEIKYYLYGLTSVRSAAPVAALLAAYNVKLEFAGCKTETPKYRQDMLYNDYIKVEMSLKIPDLIKKSGED